MRGEEHRIRPCVGANHCLDRIYQGGEALCLHNVSTGREKTMPHVIHPAADGKKKIVVVGDGFKTGCFLWWDGNKDKGTWVVRSWPQYAVAVPKGNDHVWYRATFQLELNDGTFYSGYWEMDIHFRYIQYES